MIYRNALLSALVIKYIIIAHCTADPGRTGYHVTDTPVSSEHSWIDVIKRTVLAESLDARMLQLQIPHT